MTARKFASLALLLTAGLLLSGCSGSSKPSKAGNQTKKPQDGQVTDGERCRSKLAAAIVRVAPATLVLQDRPERAINGLNSWIAACAAGDVDDLQLSEGNIALIGDSVRVTSRRFTVNDASYIRDCLLIRDLSNSLVERLEESNDSGTKERDRVQAIFDWLIRNISLLSVDEQRIPLGAFDVLLTGRGTPEDRAWLFAEALRQQQIDAVIVRAAAAPEEGGVLASAEWLVAVCLEDKSLLFDLQTGTPVLADDLGNVLDSPPAEIEVLKEHVRWKDSTVEVIAQLPAFSPRMLVLQEQLSADDAAILYEELTGGVSEILPITSRIETASSGLWTADRISVWSYPEDQVVTANALSEQQQQEFDNLMRPFDGPFQQKAYQSESLAELTTVPEQLKASEREELVQQRLLEDYARILGSSDDMFGRPSRQLLKTRLDQIRGVADTSVIQRLQQVRISSMQKDVSVRIPEVIQQRDGLSEVMKIPFPKAILEVNQSTTGDSLYWSAMCQMDRQEYGVAITTLMNYRRQYPDGKWKYPSLVNHGLCLLQQQRTDDAREILKEANQDDNPEQQRAALLLKAIAQ